MFYRNTGALVQQNMEAAHAENLRASSTSLDLTLRTSSSAYGDLPVRGPVRL